MFKFLFQADADLHFPNPVAFREIELVAESGGEPEVVDVSKGEVVRILNDLISNRSTDVTCGSDSLC